MSGLWPHQERALRLTGLEFSRGHKAVCVVMSTGAGKTRLGGEFAHRHLLKRPEGKVLWSAHREELVSQAYDALTALGLDCGVIQANPTRPYNPYRHVQVASTQTLLARGAFPEATMLVLDEFHHYASDKWEALGQQYRQRGVPIIGLTATPIRGDGRGFEGLMDALVCPVQMRELIENGFLVPYTLVDPGRTLRPNEIAQAPVDAYLAHARGRKAIVFAPNVKEATKFRDEFRAKGITVELVTGDMEAGARRSILEAYKEGRVQVLTNVGVLTEGFDDRPTSCVILARSFGSLSLYLQCCGRGLRCSPETGKQDCIIIDLHGTCRKDDFGEPRDDREWTLEGDGIKHKNLEAAKERFCKLCKVLLQGSAKTSTVCEECTYARPEAAALEIANIQLVKYAAKRAEPLDKKRLYFERLKGIAKRNNYNKWQPHAKYKAIYGEGPPREWW